MVIDRLYPGNLHLTQAIRPMIEDCQRTLSLDEAKRERRVIRITLNQAAPLARQMALALAKLLAGEVEIKVGVR